MPDHIQVIVSTLTGGGIAALLFRYFITKILKDISTALESINELAKELTTVAVKLERIDQDIVMLHDHDRKIARLEACVRK